MKSPSIATLSQRSARASFFFSRAIATSKAGSGSLALAACASRRASSRVKGVCAAARAAAERKRRAKTPLFTGGQAIKSCAEAGLLPDNQDREAPGDDRGSRIRALRCRRRRRPELGRREVDAMSLLVERHRARATLRGDVLDDMKRVGRIL